jgi:hypothetical protein
MQNDVTETLAKNGIHWGEKNLTLICSIETNVCKFDHSLDLITV